MPTASRMFIRRAIGPLHEAVAAERNELTDTRLALTLTFVAGAMNAGALVAVGQYTSHMSGIVSALADNLALGAWVLALGGLGALASFIGGAAVSAALINWARRHRAGAQYAMPLLLEAALLGAFGLGGMAAGGTRAFALLAAPALCFVMGLQNATITKVSGARMRTTHVTGIVTDMGIELGKLFYWNRSRDIVVPSVRADRTKLRLLGGLLAAFALGGVLGALGFARFGFATALPFALVLMALGCAPSISAALSRGAQAR
ncbi:YoaK family protein [Roseococcus sp. YIM B11640]|uniref:YoaK family protein n=1 Tax=Roseococcus sp. YIM B11640 TaxID=3133973 RepID=UPI003C7A1788